MTVNDARGKLIGEEDGPNKLVVKFDVNNGGV